MKVATICKTAALFCTVFFALQSHAQSLYLIGGALKTCASTSTQNCIENTRFSDAKKTTIYRVSKSQIDAINTLWPTQNTLHKQKTRRLLNAIKSDKLLSKSSLKNALKDGDNGLYNAWSDSEFHFVFDTLEVPQLIDDKRLTEQVAIARNSESASNDILNAIATEIFATKGKTLYLITASSRDPYSAADFYQGLFATFNIKSEWLPLTPALAAAVSNNDCSNLDKYRNALNLTFNRAAVYPDLTAKERALCEQGEAGISALIENADAVFFNGGDQSLTKQVLFKPQTATPFAWTQSLKTRPIIIGTSAGTAVQAGGENALGRVAMITNGSSENALNQGAYNSAAPSENCSRNQACSGLQHDSLTYDQTGGLGSFTFGLLDTHFSERGRTFRLAVLAQTTGQKLGFGVDETTALYVNTARNTLSVLGKHGVVVVNVIEKNAFDYFYYPSGSTIALTDFNHISEKQEVFDDVISVSNVIKQGRLRETLQGFCRNNQTALALEQADTPTIMVTRSKQTRCEQDNNNRFQIKHVRMSW